MAFVGIDKGQAQREDKKERILQLGFEKLEQEPPLLIPDKEKPWRASDIKNPCPRQVYYSRYSRGEGRREASAPAVFGTVVHAMFNYGSSDEELWHYLFEQELRKAGAHDLYDPRTRWIAQAKPFGLSAFRDASPRDKISALYKRYFELDRLNYEHFWNTNPFAIYRHPPTGRLAEEARLKGAINGSKIVTTADLVLTNVYTGEIYVGDWKTGRASEETQLATYAMIAEQNFGLDPDSIEWGFFILSGAGECFNKRGQLPFAYSPDYESSVIKVYLPVWRPIVVDRIKRLQQREKTGKWTPKLNALCKNTCEYRHRCPIGQAVREVEDEAASKS